MKIGIIGCGNMGSAILTSFLTKIDNNNICVFDTSKELLKSIKEKFGVNIAESNAELAKNSDLIVLAIKPDVCDEVLQEISPHISFGKILISIAAGISTDYIKKYFDHDIKLIRLMPNTPALISEGLIAMVSQKINKNELSSIKDLLSTLGLVVEVEEKYMDAITGISGSSPAYVYMFIEAMADAGVLAGLPRELAYKISAQAVMGSAKMILETGKHPAVLKDMVCSPGGTTIEAVRTLEKTGFRSSVIEAVISCVEKSKSLA